MQDGVVYRGISPDVLMVDQRGRIQVGFVKAPFLAWLFSLALHSFANSSSGA